MTSAVDLIQRQLEFLKYVGGTVTVTKKDKEVQRPTGEGMGIGIVILPDLLLDFRKYNLKRRSSRVCIVGGRAARIACVLQHLKGEEDGTFQAYLLTKTGNLGRLLLQDEFYRGPSQKYPRMPLLEHLLLRKGEPRCALREKQDGQVESRRPRKTEELSAGELAIPGIASVICRSRAICLASVKTPDFQKILTYLIQKLDQSRQGLFIDTRRAGDRDMLNLKAALERPPSELDKIAGVFLRAEEKNAFLAAFKLKDLDQTGAEQCKLRLVSYGSGHTVSFLSSSTSFELPCQATFQNEGVSECLKAGVLLAWSVHAAVQELKRSRPNAFECLNSEWPGDSYWKTVLGFGVALAEVRDKKDAALKLRDLVRPGALPGSDHYPETAKFQPHLSIPISPPAGTNRRLVLSDVTMPRRYAQLAGFRRISVVRRRSDAQRNALACRDLAICDTPHCPDGCPNRKRTGFVGAIMIDLDSTLMNSTEQRNRAIAKALAELPNAARGTDPVTFFTANVYELHDLYVEKGLELVDFRQKWNDEGWYITYLLLAEDPELCDGARQWSAVQSPSGPELDKKAQWQKRFLSAYNTAATEHREEIRRAQRAFESVQMHAFKEARDFLRSLQLTGSFGLYVVSEGDPDTQWFKLQSTGLADFFDREHVLTTGDAVEPPEFRAGLKVEKAALEAEGTYLKDAIERLRESVRQLSTVQDTLRENQNADQAQATNNVFFKTSQEIIARIQQLLMASSDNDMQQKVAEFVSWVIDCMGSKTFKSFYAGAIRAIQRDPSAPRSKLKRFGELLGPAIPKRLKFAMIGDRQKNDIEPPSRLLKEKDKIITIRMNSLLYSDHDEEPVDRNWANPPSYVVDTLAQAKVILLNKKAWNDTWCAPSPPIFNWRVDHQTPNFYSRPPLKSEEDPVIGLDYVLRGCKMPFKSFPTISQICAGILGEHLESCDRKEIDEILKTFVDPEQGLGPLPQMRERAALLCSFVRQGAIYKQPLLDLQDKVALRIATDAKPLKEDTAVRDEIRTQLEDLAIKGNPAARKVASDALKQLFSASAVHRA